MASPLKNWLKVRLIAGFFVTVPAVATAWILWVFWSKIDDIFAPMYARLLGRSVPGLGFLTAIAIIFLMGSFARNVFGRRVLAVGDTLRSVLDLAEAERTTPLAAAQALARTRLA